MKMFKYTYALLILVFLFAPARAMESGEVMKHLDADGWKVMVHLRAIPEEHREMAKATHHISITATDKKGNQVTDAVVTFEFVRADKVVAEGEAKYMGDMGGEHAMHNGHYGADLTLPAPGEYTLNIKLVKGKTTRKASTTIEAP